jgi:hypothetical protein
MIKIGRILCAISLVIGVSVGAVFAQSGDFDVANMRCLDFVNGQGDNASNKSKAEIAEIWIFGYLTGNYNGRDKLKLVDNPKAEKKIISSIVSKCRENPEVTLLTVAEFTAGKSRSVPATISADFNPKTYLCGDYVDGLSGSAADVMKGDLASIWAFAFVQGHVNSVDDEILIPIENKPAIIGSIKKNCKKNPNYSYFDLTAAVAPMVTPK